MGSFPADPEIKKKTSKYTIWYIKVLEWVYKCRGFEIYGKVHRRISYITY